ERENTMPVSLQPRIPSMAPLRMGSTGAPVSQLQLQLNQRGEKLTASGTFGPATQEAVRRFQLTNKIQPANGVVGPSTLAALQQSRMQDGFEAAPQRSSMPSLSGAWSAVKQGASNVAQSAEAGFDRVALGANNTLSARGGKTSPNHVSSENKLLPNG